MSRVFWSLLLLAALCQANPLERTNNGGQQMVVDVPAGVFEPELDEAVQVPVKDGSSEEKIEIVPVVPVETSDINKDAETVIVKEDPAPPKVPTRDSDYDFFNVRIPFPSLFVYRRPVIRDPFSSFNGFQQPQPYQPSQFNVLNHMEAMMKRMQEQMSSLWGALLNPNYDAIRPPRPPSFNRFPAFPAETKVIDGQVVQVNKTVHKFGDKGTSGIFSYQVINIRPQPTDAPNVSSSPTEVAHEDTGSAPTEVKTDEVKETESAKTPEVVATTEKNEDPVMNEIDEQQRDRLVDAEKFPFLLNRFKEQYTVDDGSDINKLKDENRKSEKLVKLEEFDFVPHGHPLLKVERQAIDLSDDIRVNKILEEQNRKAQLKMINPDAELFVL